MASSMLKNKEKSLIFTQFSSPNFRAIILCLLFSLTSCVPTPSNKRKGADYSENLEETSSSETTPTSPSTLSNNYFQNGQTETYGALSLPVSFSDSFYLRGKEVDSYIRNKGLYTPVCLSTIFSKSTDNKVLIVSAYPQYFYNFSSNTKEYFYLIRPSDKTENQARCKNTALESVFSLTGNIGYALNEICPNCIYSKLNSNESNIFQTTGSLISEIKIDNLSIVIENSYQAQQNTISCSGNNECLAIGLDCCSSNQCVKDKQVKSTTDISSSEYLMAVEDINTNPSHITSYPHLFHLCSNVVNENTEIFESQDPSVEARKIFLEKQDLYNCLTPQEGEMSICTTLIEKPTLTSFYTDNNDRSFYDNYIGSYPPPKHSITKVTLGETLLFQDNQSYFNDLKIGVNGSLTGNDNLTDPTEVKLLSYPSGLNENDPLRIHYKIDGSCVEIHSSLAKCKKYYIQGQNLGKVTDHYPASNKFIIPYYADISENIAVEVNGGSKYRDTDWRLNVTSKIEIEFLGSQLAVSDTQDVAITYFVNTNSFPVLESKNGAAQRVKELCQCADLNCTLKPFYLSNSSGGQYIADYTCQYPDPITGDPPLQQLVLLNSKTVPVRFFDKNGVSHSTINSITGNQEGSLFEYKNNDLLRPNNTESIIGFNEIYGSLNHNSLSPLPAKEIRVKAGKTYDIFTDSGIFSSCYYCGNDYYNTLLKLFPHTFDQRGGGFTPDKTTTNRFTSTTYRADDLLFGRACFVPATMLPYSHKEHSDPQTQRLNRLSGQHFLFANGYQRDWFGFDYGALIGSFNGVTWFAIGSQRRIKAETNKLFLAINSYWGDLTQEGSYTVTVSEATSIVSSGSSITTNFYNNGAQCQQYHTCQTDADCASKLGWEYTCENVTNITTNYPLFDAEADEIPSASNSTRIFSLHGNNSGGQKRCVYRARGAPCLEDYANQAIENNFTQTAELGLHACQNGYRCQSFVSFGGKVKKFNNKISRYGKSIKTQNADSSVAESDADTFGLSTRLIGRPLKYIGDEEITNTALSNLGANYVSALCLPGKDPNFTSTLFDQQTSLPNEIYLGAKTVGIGMSSDNNMKKSSLSSCSIFDPSGNYFYKDPNSLDKLLTDSDLVRHASSQAISTNALTILESLGNQEILKNFDSEQIISPYFEKNRCLRAPGSPCFTDLECAPSQFLSNKLSTINDEDPNLHDILNMYELKFWKEDLVCGQKESKTSEDYDPANNKCCRETGKKITIGTLVNQEGFSTILPSTEAPIFDPVKVPGIDINLNSPLRYSRNTTIADLSDKPLIYPPLKTARANSCNEGPGCVSADSLKNQFKSLDEIASRTCCSGHWIRNFHDESGGGHRWDSTKSQDVIIESFKCLNWVPSTRSSSLEDLNCSGLEDFNDPDCPAKQMTSSQANIIQEWLNRLELLGIPQIAVQSEDNTNLYCSVDPSNPSIQGNSTIPYFLKSGASAEYQSTEGNLLSADDSTNFDNNLKKIFSPDTFSCCLPAGTTVAQGADPKTCCTGFINQIANKCALPDYTNVSVYLNRYVSSEARNLSENFFDSQTGLIKNTNMVEQLACFNQMCASGVIARGVAYSNFKIEGLEKTDNRIKRFIDGDNEANNFNGKVDLFKSGLRWSNDVYCVPEGISNNSSDGDIIVINCNAL